MLFQGESNATRLTWVKAELHSPRRKHICAQKTPLGQRGADDAMVLLASMPQRAKAWSSLTRASTQRAPSGVTSFFQNGAWVLR